MTRAVREVPEPFPFQANERRVAEDLRECYWLYVVTNCKSKPDLQEPIKNPARFPWHEACLPRLPALQQAGRLALRRGQVKKVGRYYLSVDALTQPMQVREKPEQYRPQSDDS